MSELDEMRRFVEHTGGLYCDEYHPEGTCEWQERCDEPGCRQEATCGFPTPHGYRRTCGRHMMVAHLARTPGEPEGKGG